MARAFLRAFLLAISGLLMTLVGFLMVAIGIPFRRNIGEPVPFTDPRYAHLGAWQLVRLPAWLLPWDNIFDGMNGDKRGWYANWCVENSIAYPSFRSMWIWTALRNPANYWSRVMTGVDVSRCVITKIAGKDVVEADEGFPGWQLLLASRDDGKKFPRFFAEIPIGKGHVFLIDIGWKIKLAHNDVTADSPMTNRIKGSVFTISPWKYSS